MLVAIQEADTAEEQQSEEVKALREVSEKEKSPVADQMEDVNKPSSSKQ